MASFVLKIISITLGLFFIFIGTLKLTPSVNKDLHKELRKAYIKSAKVFPFVGVTGWKPNGNLYRKAVGGAEVVCGAILATIPGPLKEAANILMILLMVNDIYSHYALDDGLEKGSLSIVFLLLLTCRLIIYLQIKSRENEVIEKTEEIKEREAQIASGKFECEGHSHNLHPAAGPSKKLYEYKIESKKDK
ncbi:hypothetical protein FSP39_009167 [Pinctada imbricata]|uniref:Novel acetylcholine receptor chaperone n=1 Tax=Pinctada imbricata TaxID=66713 RepID=A0AA88Y3Z4_PINIB|nr:hypothetical protein FSP39_009167 [Pinctada imbricata]